MCSNIYNYILNVQDSISKLILSRYELDKIIMNLAVKYNLATSVQYLKYVWSYMKK